MKRLYLMPWYHTCIAHNDRPLHVTSPWSRDRHRTVQKSHNAVGGGPYVLCFIGTLWVSMYKFRWIAFFFRGSNAYLYALPLRNIHCHSEIYYYSEIYLATPKYALSLWNMHCHSEICIVTLKYAFPLRNMHCHSEICIVTLKYAFPPRKKNRYSPEMLPTHPQRTYMYKTQYIWHWTKDKLIH